MWITDEDPEVDAQRDELRSAVPAAVHQNEGLRQRPALHHAQAPVSADAMLPDLAKVSKAPKGNEFVLSI